MTAKNTLKIVDVSKLDQETSKKILEGFTDQGFLFVDGHGFTQKEVDHLFKLSKDFFALPLEKKQELPINSEDSGYTSFNQENLDPSLQVKGDPKEALNIGQFDFTTGAYNQETVPEMFHEGTDNFDFVAGISVKLYQLGIQILKLLAIGLEIPEDKGGANWFSDRHRPDAKSITALRLLHYPPTTVLDSQQKIRAGAHTDYGSITLLFQQEGEEGLELLNSSGEWNPIHHVKSPNEAYRAQGQAAPIVVNIADQLSFWTNGILKSTTHRVVLPAGEKDRYSIVFFFDAEDDVRLVPIPSDIVKAADNNIEDHANKKDTDYITARSYFDKRFQETYVSGH